MQPFPPVLEGTLVFVTSPTSRCGTTLVQRLLNSSPEALVFGEGVGAALLELVEGVAKRAPLLARADEHRADLVRALAGEQFWCPHLLPDPEGYAALFVETLERFVRFHEAEARRHGRRLWGAKLPTVPLSAMRTLRAVLPGARVLYIWRELLAAARSAKARRFLECQADFERFGELWRQGRSVLEGLADDPGLLVLAYERLERGDPTVLEELEAFTGARGLDPAVLERRVNTWAGAEAEGHAPEMRIEPRALEPREVEWLG